MRLSIAGLTFSGALLWGVYGIFLPGLINLIAPPYGEHFLLTMSSVYPGYHVSRTLADLLVGTGYGFMDGAIAGFLLAWVYNFFAGQTSPSA